VSAHRTATEADNAPTNIPKSIATEAENVAALKSKITKRFSAA
jgi:hypothetical protein